MSAGLPIGMVRNRRKVMSHPGSVPGSRRSEVDADEITQLEIEQRQVNIGQMKASLNDQNNVAICHRVEQARRNAELLLKADIAMKCISKDSSFAEASPEDAKAVKRLFYELLKQSLETMKEISNIKTNVKS